MVRQLEKSPRLVIVSGLSGAGKSIAIDALEDMNYYCIDNLPLELVENAVSYFVRAPFIAQRFALGLDVRSLKFIDDFNLVISRISKKIKPHILFLTCNDEQLAQRFSTTRRRHPLLDEGGELIAAIRREMAVLSSFEELAETVFDTSSWTPHYLSRQVEQHFSHGRSGRNLYVTISSFGFKYGMLRPVDSVFDVRFLKNPHFEPSLKESTGLEPLVRDYVFSDPNTSEFLKKITELNQFLLPQYYQEGKHYFRIGIGCTGGKHRSVALAESLAMNLAQSNIPNIYISVSHRDLDIHPRELVLDL